MIRVRPVQPLKADLPMLVTLSGKVKLVRPVQLEKAESSMLVTLPGSVMFVRFVQPEKAEFSMRVTLSDSVTLVSFMHLAKAPGPTLVTPCLIMTLVISRPQEGCIVEYVSIAPFPLMVSTVPSSVHVHLPVLPLVVEAAAASNENAVGNDTNSIVSVSSALKMRFAHRFPCFMSLTPLTQFFPIAAGGFPPPPNRQN